MNCCGFYAAHPLRKTYSWSDQCEHIQKGVFSQWTFITFPQDRWKTSDIREPFCWDLHQSLLLRPPYLPHYITEVRRHLNVAGGEHAPCCSIQYLWRWPRQLRTTYVCFSQPHRYWTEQQGEPSSTHTPFKHTPHCSCAVRSNRGLRTPRSSDWWSDQQCYPQLSNIYLQIGDKCQFVETLLSGWFNRHKCQNGFFVEMLSSPIMYRTKKLIIKCVFSYDSKVFTSICIALKSC